MVNKALVVGKCQAVPIFSAGRSYFFLTLAVANFWRLLVNFVCGRPCDGSVRATLVQSRSVADKLTVNGARAPSEGPLVMRPNVEASGNSNQQGTSAVH